MRALRRSFFVVVLTPLSGASTLLAQIVWARLLTLDIGFSAIAATTTLAAFLGGLALGAALAGRLAARASPRRALSLYAALQLAVALAALGVEPALAWTRPLLAAAYQDGSGGLAFATLRVLVCLLTVGPPSTLMGATFPLGVRWVEQPGSQAGRMAGLFYAANGVGAAIGAAATGFVLLPSAGLHFAALIGAGLHAIVAAGALVLRLFVRADLDRFSLVRPGDRPVPAHEWSARPHPNAAAVALAISGCLALVHQAAWTRVIAVSVGPTIYAFTTILAIGLFGLATGAAFATRRLRRMRRPVTGLAVAQIAAALGAFVAFTLVARLPAFVQWAAAPPRSYARTLAIESLAMAVLLLPLTLALGAAFPFGVATAAPVADVEGDAARAASRVYVAQTLGAIGGALAGGFVLIPQLGLQRTILLAGLLGILAGVELIWRTRRRGRARIWVPIVGLLAAALGIALPAWDPAQLADGAYDQLAMHDRGQESVLVHGALLYYDDGAAGTVAVRRLAGTIGVTVDGTRRASNGDDLLAQVLAAHLPLLLHPAPHDVCVLGLGTGVTSGAALAHPVDRVDTIERSREVVHASDFFSTENRAVLREARHHLIAGDGRTHVWLGRRTYDVVIAEPPRPWIAGGAPFVTREQFAAARDRLAEGGLFAQRFSLRAVGRHDLPSLLATFTSIFAHTALWLVGEDELIAIGGRDPVTPRLEALSRRWQVPGVAADLERVRVRDPFALMSMFVADESALHAALATAPLLTDDRLGLELSAPWRLQDRGDAVAWLMDVAQRAPRPAIVEQAESAATAAQWRDRALMLAAAGAPAWAYDAAARALAQDPIDAAALSVIAQTAIPLRRTPAALALLETMRARAPASLVPLLALSRLRETAGDRVAAVDAATEATKAFPQAFEGWQQLASVLSAHGDRIGLTRVLEAMQAQFPDRWETRYFRAAWHLLRDEPSEAVRLGEPILRERASEPRTLALLGAAYARLGLRDRARDALEACLQSDPRNPASYTQLARLELDTFNPRRAAALFSEALILDPRSPVALNGLADALTGLGRPDRAAALRARAAAAGF